MIVTESVLAMPDYKGGENFHKMRSLNMQVAHHGIIVPESNKINAISMHVHVEEEHFVGSAKRSSGDTPGKKSDSRSQETDSKTEGLSDVIGWDMATSDIIILG